MKTKKILISILFLFLVQALIGCKSQESNPNNGEINQPTEEEFSKTPTLVNDFNTPNASAWMFGTWSFYQNATMFREENGTFLDGKLILELKKEDYKGKKYTGAHYQSNQGFGYGRYEIMIKPAKSGGIVSSFFLYSDYDKTKENNKRWNEIDFEFISDPENNNEISLQFNYWNHDVSHTGASGNEVRKVETSISPKGLRDTYHKLVIDYTSKYIKWFVDDICCHTVTKNLPVSNTLKIMMNIWRPETSTHPKPETNWAGLEDDSKLPEKAFYDYVKYYPLKSN